MAAPPAKRPSSLAFALSSKGKTPVSDTVNRGSNPRGASSAALTRPPGRDHHINVVGARIEKIQPRPPIGGGADGCSYRRIGEHPTSWQHDGIGRTTERAVPDKLAGHDAVLPVAHDAHLDGAIVGSTVGFSVGFWEGSREGACVG